MERFNSDKKTGNCQSNQREYTHGDDGAEEFSEQIYDENAPTPPEFDNPHVISITGGTIDTTPSGPKPLSSD